MLNQQTLDKLRSLKLTGMAESFAEQLQKPLPDLDFTERLAMLVERECLLRENRKIKRRITMAKLQQAACIEDIDYDKQRGLVKSKILELSRNAWVQQHFNVLITGSTGCGKTYLACALAHCACLAGFTSRYYRLTRLWEDLKVARANGTYIQILSQLAKIDILLLDDWGLVTPEPKQRQDLLELLDDRYKKRSTVVTSQLPVGKWHEYIHDATFADAIMDRLVNNAIKIELKGPTMRGKKQGEVQQKQEVD